MAITVLHNQLLKDINRGNRRNGYDFNFGKWFDGLTSITITFHRSGSIQGTDYIATQISCFLDSL